MRLKEPYAYQLSTASVVKIVAIKGNKIIVRELSSHIDVPGQKSEPKTYAYPIEVCRRYLILPDSFNTKIDLLVEPVTITSLNTSKKGVITAIGKKHIDVCFEDCHTTSIRLGSDVCQKLTDIPQEIIDISKDLAKNPRSFFTSLHTFPVRNCRSVFRFPFPDTAY